MITNVQRAVRILRYRGYKIKTTKGRIVSIDSLKVSKRNGINSRKLESIALRMAEAPRSALPPERAGFRRAKSIQRRYAYRARKLKLPKAVEMTDKIIKQRLHRGESPAELFTSAKLNMYHYADIAYQEGVNHLIEDLKKANIMPKTRAYLESMPNLSITDTHLAELQKIKYNENYTLEQKDAIGLAVAQEGHQLAVERLKSMGGMF